MKSIFIFIYLFFFVFNLQAYVGTVDGGNVHIRTEPSMEQDNIVTQVNQGCIIEVVQEKGDFCEIKPLSNMKAFVARKNVTVDKMEDNKVSGEVNAYPYLNVRLDQPKKSAPIIAKLKGGYKLDGTVCNKNWLQIDVPVNFYIAKKYVKIQEEDAEKNEEKILPKKSIFTNLNDEMKKWHEKEKKRNEFEKWQDLNVGKMADEFYNGKPTISLSGILRPYNDNISNKPGNFLLIDNNTGSIKAYLYSAHINLRNDEFINKNITLEGLERENNDFAYPAYYVISAHKK